MYPHLQFKVDGIDKYVCKLENLLEMGMPHKWITLTILKMKAQNNIPPV